MRWLPSIWYEPSEAALWSSGRVVIHAAFGFGLLLTVLITWAAGYAVVVVPIILMAGFALARLFRHPLANLAVVLGLFVLVADYEEGIQLTEVFYGLYYFAFLGHWFLTRVVLYRENILADPADKAVLLFLIGVTLSIPLTFLFGGEPRGLLSEWTSLMLLAFYFPVKEACIRYEHGTKVIIGVILWIGFFAAVRNIFLYQAALSNVDAAWQVARGRVYFNDNVLMVTSLVSLIVLSFARKLKDLLPTAALFLVILTGLILTQSRAFWMAFLFGACVMFVVSERPQKRRIFAFTGVGIVSFAAIALLFAPHYVELILYGLADRLVSIGSAFTDDVSMVNRLREAKTVLGRIAENPILGYGMSVPYTFFDLAHMATDRDAFVHNAYIGLWYKFGIWGLGLILVILYRAVRVGIRAARPGSRLSTRIGAFSAGVALIALALAANTSNPFFLMDGTLLFGVLPGLASGAHRRSEIERETHTQ